MDPGGLSRSGSTKVIAEAATVDETSKSKKNLISCTFMRRRCTN